jgi:hypothetical protein
MQRLEVSSAVRHIYMSLGGKGLKLHILVPFRPTFIAKDFAFTKEYGVCA